VPSVNRTHIARLAVLALCGVLLIGAASGCSTTQDKARQQQARATHILKAREDRQKERRKDKGNHGDKRGKQGSSDGRSKQ
jgi:type II secretory pathway pseudopilin PulG